MKSRASHALVRVLTRPRRADGAGRQSRRPGPPAAGAALSGQWLLTDVGAARSESRAIQFAGESRAGLRLHRHQCHGGTPRISGTATASVSASAQAPLSDGKPVSWACRPPSSCVLAPT